MESRRLTAAQVGREIGTGPHTIYRWWRDGLLMPDGERLRLRGVRVGGRLFFERAWVDAFIEANTDAFRQHHQSRAKPPADERRRHRPSSKQAREREIARARARLEAAGV